MCVTCAIKLPRDRDTGKPVKDAKWVLFKIRDRPYDPVYKFKTYDDGKTTTLFLVDEDSDWTECIRVSNKTGETELMFVNSALNNLRDKRDGVDPTNISKTSSGLVARRNARFSNLEEAVKEFTEMQFDGCTYVSDGEKCFLIESSIDNKYTRELKKIKDMEERRSKAKEFDHTTTTEEITDWISVRANHGITNKKVGYEDRDGISYRSSKNRKDYAEMYIKEHVFEVDDIIPVIDKMGEPLVHKNPFLRPKRIQSEIQEWIKNGGKALPIYSTSAFVLTSKGEIQTKLYDARIASANIQRLFSKDFPIKVSIMR